MSRKRLITCLLIVAASGLFAFWYSGWFSYLRNRAMRIALPDAHYSNVLPEDYVGPQTCSRCHQEQYELWSAHPHRFMNQLPSKAAIKGDFNEHVWTIRPGYTVTFSTKGKDYLMTVDRPTNRTRYKVTRTVGSRFVQFYIGVQTEGEEPPDDQVYTTEHKLPFGYWFRLKRWLPADYFDVGGGDWSEPVNDGLPVVDGVDGEKTFISYTKSCVHCHNTYPHAYRIFRPRLAGFPDAVIDGDFKPLQIALSDHVEVKPTADAFEDLPYLINPDKDLVTVGISCESCHLGGREHAKNRKKISFFPSHPHVYVRASNSAKPFTGERSNPATSQGTCAQCHSAYAVAKFPNGVRVRNSSESLDMQAGACTTEIRCVTCHEPHTHGVPSGGPTVKAHLAACTNCHPHYSTPQQAAAHSRHSANTGVDCLDCHMPRISQGIDEVSRTHRISQPVEQSMISAGAPNACNLCHLDKTVRWALDELKRGWGREVRPLHRTPAEYLDTPAGKAWLNSEESITRIVATEAYGRTGRWKSDLPGLLGALSNHNPTNRVFGQFAVERILGRRLERNEYDVLAGPRRWTKQIRQLRALLEKKK